MFFEDTYRTISTLTEGIYKERGSKFIAFAIPVDTEEEVKIHLAGFKKKFHDARHHCYAYRLGFDKSAFRINDDGEPSGTAGRPIFSQIISNDLTNIMIVVVRYFGGIKLGRGGLVNAYKAAAISALEKSDIVTKVVLDLFEIEFAYESMEEVMKIIKESNINQMSHNYGMNCTMRLSVRKNHANQVYEKLEKIKQLKIKNLQTF